MALTRHLDMAVAENHATSHLYHAPDGDPLEDSGWRRLAAFALMATEDPHWKRYAVAVKAAINDCIRGDKNTDWVADTGMAAATRATEEARATWEEIQGAGGVVSTAAL